MNHVFNKRTITIKPYVVSKRFDGNSHGEIAALDWNESLFGPSETVRNDLLSFIANARLNLYPDGDLTELAQEISNFVGVGPEHILTFNGSDSALRDCILSLLSAGDKIAVIEPEYNQIDTFVHMANGEKASIYPADTFNLDISKICSEIVAEGYKYLYMSNPSNPVGRFLADHEIRKILDSGVILLLDEAYVEFAPKSHIRLVGEYDNLIILRTFSKAFGLAGLRLGYLCSNAQNIKMIAKVRNSKEINILSQVAAISALRNIDEVREQITEMESVKLGFIEQINRMEGEVFARNSHANFVLVTSPKIDEIITTLNKRSIFIRDRRSMYQLENTARITIGRREQMDKVAAVIRETVSS